MAARSLVGMVLAGPARRVGVEPFFSELVAGMEEELAQAGHTVLLLVVPDIDAELVVYRRWAAQGGVEAVVVVNLLVDDPRPRALAELGLTAVLAGRHEAPPDLTSVVTDDAGEITTALELLHSLGHRVVARVSGPPDLVHTLERSTAMARAAQRLGLVTDVVASDYSADGGVRATRELMGSPTPPTALLFDNDVMAVAALEHLTASGTAVPGRVSLMSLNDSALCDVAVPPLSAMSVDVHEHGVALGRAVCSVLVGEPARALPGPPVRIVLRSTTARPPAAG